MWRTSPPVRLHDAGTFWGIIIFTRSCKMLPFEYDLFQKVKKVIQRSTSNLSEILMWRICVKLQKDNGNFCSYCFHKTAWPWASLKGQKSHTKANVKLIRDFYVENIHIKLQYDTCNLRRVITFTKSSQMLPAWKFKKVTQSSRSKLFEILMSRTSLPVELQHDAGKIWCIIIFTRSCKMLPFEHDLVQKDTGNSCRVIVFTRQLDLELVWKVKKVTQRSMSNSSEIFM